MIYIAFPKLQFLEKLPIKTVCFTGRRPKNYKSPQKVLFFYKFFAKKPPNLWLFFYKSCIFKGEFVTTLYL